MIGPGDNRACESIIVRRNAAILRVGGKRKPSAACETQKNALVGCKKCAIIQ